MGLEFVGSHFGIKCQHFTYGQATSTGHIIKDKVYIVDIP